jgi:hypothetical protein
MSTVEQFEREWKRLLKISRKAADVFRREHNRAILKQSLGETEEYDLIEEQMILDYEAVTRIENEKATAKSVRV